MSYIPRPQPRRKPDFSLTIINIVFLLLLFFIATGSLVKSNEIEADVPVTKDMPLERLPRPLLLMTADGQLYVDGSPVQPAELVAAASNALEKMQGTAVFVNVLAERTIPGREFLSVVDRLRQAEIRVRVVTLRDETGNGQ